MKTNSALRRFQSPSLRDDQYALIVLDKEAGVEYRLFPIDSKEDTALSIQHFDYHKNDLGETERATAAYFLTKAAKFWGMTPPKWLEKLAAKEPPFSNKVHSEEVVDPEPEYKFEKFALYDKYPIDTPELVKKASAYFDRYWQEFTGPERIEYAKNVKAQAEELGTKVSPLIEKYAGAWYDEDTLKTEIRKRIQAVNSELMKDYYLELYEKRASLKPMEFIDLLERLDKKAGLTSYYSNGISDPYHSVIGNSPRPIDTWNGHTITDQDIMKIADDFVSKYYGDTIANNLKQNPEMIMSLPSTDKELIYSKIVEK